MKTIVVNLKKYLKKVDVSVISDAWRSWDQSTEYFIEYCRPEETSFRQTE